MASSVPYQLAFKAKKQNDAKDYRVLGRSEGPLSVEDFEAIFSRLSVGTMPFKAKYDGEREPWVTFGAIQVGQVTYVAAIRQEWTDRNDARSRPVAAMCCICLPYESLRESRTTYETIYKAIPPLGTFLDSEESMSAADEGAFSPCEEQWQKVAQVIDDVGFKYCASVASLLITSPVAIVKGVNCKVEARLSFLDAATSLLPYGVRAHLNASAWMYSSSSETTRLGFADAARQEQRRVAWGELPEDFIWKDSEARDYFYLLMNIRERRSTLEIVKALAAQTAPLDFTARSTFLSDLRATDRLNLLLQDLKNRTVTADEVRAAFAEETAVKLTDAQKAALLRSVIEDLQPHRDLALLHEHWSELLAEHATRVVATLLDSEGEPDKLRALFDLAVEKHWLTRYLETLLRSAADGAGLKTTAVDLLYGGLKALSGERAEKDAQRIRKSLVTHRQLLYELACIVLRENSAKAALSWFEWLADGDQSLSGELDAFAIAAGLRRRDVTFQQLRRISAGASEFVPRLMRMAAESGEKSDNSSALERLVPAASVWLLENFDSLDEPERKQWVSLLPAIKATPVKTEQDDARVDVLSLALAPGGGELLIETYLPGRTEDFRSYAGTLVNFLNLLGESKQKAVESLITYCSGLNLGPTENAVKLLSLYTDLIPHAKNEGVRVLLADAIVKTVDSAPDLLTHKALAPRLKDFLVETNRAGGLFRPLESLLRKRLAAKEPIAVIANLVADMLGVQSINKELKIIKVLDEQKFLNDPGQIEQLVEELERQLTGHQPSSAQARQTTTYFHKAIITYDSEAANVYRQYLGNRLLNELRKAELLAELVSGEMNERLEEDVSHTLHSIYSKLKKESFIKGLLFRPAKKR